MADEWTEAIAARLARNLARFRGSADLSQEDLALRAGLSRAHISIIEHGQRSPRIDTVVKLAGGLGIELQELLEGMNWEPIERPRPRA